jgi:DNA repair exonuclease SbcCD ATPase subunit
MTSASSDESTLAGIADELYAVPPAEFIAARGARVKEAAGDKSLAARVKELRRPAPAAWIVNLLVRERRDDLEQLLDLGAELRAAQAALDRGEITRLAKERRTLVTALARAGGALATDAGQKAPPAVVDAVAATLDAGLADPEAAAAIRTGRLLRALETIGFEPVDLAEAVAVPEAGSRAAEKRAAPVRPRPRAVDDVDAELVRARTRAEGVVTRAEADASAAAAELDDLEARLREARKALVAAEREAASLEQKRDAATEAHDTARAALDTARRKRADLG